MRNQWVQLILAPQTINCTLKINDLIDHNSTQLMAMSANLGMSGSLDS